MNTEFHSIGPNYATAERAASRSLIYARLGNFTFYLSEALTFYAAVSPTNDSPLKATHDAGALVW